MNLYWEADCAKLINIVCEKVSTIIPQDESASLAIIGDREGGIAYTRIPDSIFELLKPELISIAEENGVDCSWSDLKGDFLFVFSTSSG